MNSIDSFVLGRWIAGSGAGRRVYHAVDGREIGTVTSEGIEFKQVLDFGRRVGGHALRKLTFHQRALMLKQLALVLNERRKELYPISTQTGATKGDSWVDIDGGIGTFFYYSGKGRRDFPNETFYVDGPMEALSKNGNFVGRHLCVPLEGVATHINAFNFPCWGMLEKLAPTLLAGMPAIVKPATDSCYLTQAMVRIIIESGILPEGALQLVCGGLGDLFEHLTEQDVVTFTGSAQTGRMLKSHPNIIANAVRFNMEADSLNCSILGADVTPDHAEFGLFIKEVAREITTKAGQKCTAIRRTIVPRHLLEPVIAALSQRLQTTPIGDPALEQVKMGPLVGQSQVRDVAAKLDELKRACSVVYGGAFASELIGADAEKGAFFPPTLLLCERPFDHSEPHDIEAFGPISTLLPYDTTEDAIALAKRGRGSLVGSVFTASDEVAREIVLGTAAYHGRLYLINERAAAEATGHGSPLPHMVHGGPGRAGGGEEMGGARSVMHYMQRTALQGSPTTLSHICREWMEGADRPTDRIHPFRKFFEELRIGETLKTHRRTVTEADIVNFGCLSGDHFYAHFDAIAAKESPIFKDRVAHGYFVISAAAGLFVDPGKGPVLANYGMESLRFIEPVYIGDTLQVDLTCKRKTKKFKKEEDEVPSGVVEWAVSVTNQKDQLVATYSILTLVQRQSWD